MVCQKGLIPIAAPIRDTNQLSFPLLMAWLISEKILANPSGPAVSFSIVSEFRATGSLNKGAPQAKIAQSAVAFLRAAPCAQ